MKRTISITAIFFFATHLSFGQISIAKTGESKYNEAGYLGIIQIANGKTIQSENLVINALDVTAIKGFSRIETLDKFGLITKSGAILIQVKPKVNLISVSRLFDIYHIPKNDKIPVYIDGKLVDNPETIIVAEHEIKSVNLAGDYKNEKDAGRINITTFHPDMAETLVMDHSCYWQNNQTTHLDSLLNNR